MPIDLSLSIQYSVAADDLPRWRLRRWVTQALEGACDDGMTEAACVAYTLRWVGRAEGRQLNLAYRGKDYATNVLTFEYGADPDGRVTSDIVVCLPVLRQEAREQKKPFLAHAAHLTVHGCLHALGYDHLSARDARRMEALETRIMARMGWPDPYQ